MSVEHMVWIRFHDGVSEARRREHLEALASLGESVPGVLSVCVGANFTDRAAGYTHGLIVRLRDRAALETYQKHPAHVAVAEPLKADAQLMAMDIECRGSP